MPYIAVFISLMLMLHSCKNSDNDSSKDQDDTDSLSQLQHTPKDSIPTVPPIKQRLAPGQVRVEASVVTILSDQPDSIQALRLRIQNILGYGPSTPPIPTSDTLTIPVKTDPGFLQEGAVIRAQLQHNISFKDEGDGQAWSLINIEK